MSLLFLGFVFLPVLCEFLVPMCTERRITVLYVCPNIGLTTVGRNDNLSCPKTRNWLKVHIAGTTIIYTRSTHRSLWCRQYRLFQRSWKTSLYTKGEKCLWSAGWNSTHDFDTTWGNLLRCTSFCITETERRHETFYSCVSRYETKKRALSQPIQICKSIRRISGLPPVLLYQVNNVGCKRRVPPGNYFGEISNRNVSCFGA